MVLVSWLLLKLGAGSVVVLIVGIMVLDLGVQGTQISNQSAIYRLHPDARSRITTAYMSAYFLGGVLCSSVTGALYASKRLDGRLHLRRMRIAGRSRHLASCTAARVACPQRSAP